LDLSAPLHGPSLQKVVSVRGSDGYVAAFALGEFDPSLGDRQAVLVDERDGKPLGATDGPWRLIVPQDKREARWVRNVVSIEIGTGEPVAATAATAALTPFPKATMSAAACVVWDRERSFAASVEHHDAVAFADHVSEHAAFDAGSPQPLLGRDAVVAGWKGIIEGKYFNLHWSPGIVTLGGDGSLAISHGPAWIEDLRPNAKQRFQIGEFLSTWIKDKDGQWRVLFDAGAAPMQPASAEDAAKLIASLPKECPRS
jgi:ketosteroid isomerase-like protein